VFCRHEVNATTDAAPQLGLGSRLKFGVPYLLFAVGLAAGILLGIEHHRDGMVGLFVFRETEPITAWIAVGSLLGTLPAIALALLHPRVAACALWALAACLFISSAVSFVNAERYDFWLVDALSWFATGPVAQQALLGAVFWFSRRPWQSD
jgi:hypothetical protein